MKLHDIYILTEDDNKVIYRDWNRVNNNRYTLEDIEKLKMGKMNKVFIVNFKEFHQRRR